MLLSVGKSSTDNISVCVCVSLKIIVLFGELFHGIFMWLSPCMHGLIACGAYYITMPGGLERVCQPDNRKGGKELLSESGFLKIHCH